MTKSLPMALLDQVVGGCIIFGVGAVAGYAFYFAKGALLSSSKGHRLADGIQAVNTNAPRVQRGAAWSGVFFAIQAGMLHACPDVPSHMVVTGAATNALFSMHQGRGTRAAVREGLKGAAYGAVTGIAMDRIMPVLESAGIIETVPL